MPDGASNSVVSGITMIDRISGLSLADDQAESSSREKTEKDPRRIARKYQLELCDKALEENIIVYLGTGCGKTHIAVLLIHELSHLIRKPQRNVCVFLAPTVPLVQQQAKVIEDSIDLKVGIHYGSSKRLSSHCDWEREIEEYEVLVMTPQILLRNLYHCYIKMELITLLIFDECHHAQVKSNHPYAEIMKVFYKSNGTKLPRVFGMTASPVVGKGASDQENLAKSINSLENLLDAKIYTVEDKEELDAFVASPVVRFYDYGPVANSLASSRMTYICKLEEIKHQCISTLSGNAIDHQSMRSTKRLLCRIHDNIVFCLGNLGLWGALQASHVLLSGDHTEWSELIEADGNQSDGSLCDRYLAQAAQVFGSDCRTDGRSLDLSRVDILKEPFFSKKLLRLIGILSSFRHQPSMKCIIFVNRIVTARSLSYILQHLKFLANWKCNFLIGIHSGLKSMSRKTMNIILEKFRSGELNLLVATKVGEEGLDIQTCSLVIRFDLPETVASFIQSRGRARMPQSEYAFLVDSGNPKEQDLIENFRKDEDQMNKEICSRSLSVTESFVGSEESIYKVESTGASTNSGYSISLLHHYCSKLPHDEYFDPKPEFYYFDDLEGTVCHLILPSNAPLHQIVSTPQSSIEAAKKDACLLAVKELHKHGALNDFLLPPKDDATEQRFELSSDSDSCEDEGSRGEMHEMLVPPALGKPWTNSDKMLLNSYFIKFSPHPEDRNYKEFGLFVKAPLPEEAEKMEIDLHLARGRSVMTKLVPSGFVEVNKDEITLAENFQEMFLKIILDRSDFVPEFVPLGKNDTSESNSLTFYLLLPVILQDNSSVTIAWDIITRCLASPVFRNPMNATDRKNLRPGIHLKLADGWRSSSDVEHGLVYAPHKKTFYFVTNVIHEKNGYSRYKNSGTSNHVEHLMQKFGIYLKQPGQPLLCAKPLFLLHNLLHNRKQEDFEAQHLEEYVIDLPPELCQLKIVGFSKDIGSSLSLLPSIMHRLENLLVAIKLKDVLSASFPEAAEVSAHRILEALTTEKCQERFSLERLETLGDAFLKFAVGRHLFLLHDTLDEGELTNRRSNIVKNSNLLKLATTKNLQVYIRDQSFEPNQFYTIGRPCPIVCNKETESVVHSQLLNSTVAHSNASQVKCSKGHHWLYKKTVSDVVEALIGAFLVESGFKGVTAFLRWIGIQIEFDAAQVTKSCIESNSYIPLSDLVDVCALENLLGHSFDHRGLLLQAFIHPSYNKHGGGCYQRLEFLGDAVLDFLVTSYLYSVYPKLNPGQLTDLRSVFVNNKAFANVAVERSFHKFLIFDCSALRGDIKKYVDFIKTPVSGRGQFEAKYPKVLGDLVESSVGAILLDTGFDLNRVWKLMLSFLDHIMSSSSLQRSPIRDIEDLCRSRSWNFHYVTSKKGKLFSVNAVVKGDDVSATASATNVNKKEAIGTVANGILAKLKAQGYTMKVNPLEEVLKSKCKMEAKLIGYDETPIDVVAAEARIFSEKPIERNSFCFKSDPKINLLRGIVGPSTCITPLNKQLSSTSRAAGQLKHSQSFENCSDSDLQSPGGLRKSTARSLLYEICAANRWKSPLFDRVKEEGPSHLRWFTFKVAVKIDEAPDMILESFGAPQVNQKAAAEHAAEGMLWYLKNEGYLQGLSD